MWGLELATFNREALARDAAAVPLIRSYMFMRLTIGMVGVALPIVLVVIDGFFLSDHPIRGSMSAYYHSSARDVFVGGLVSTGLFLLTYMSAKPRTYDFVLSAIGGVLVVVVALFPTGRAAADFPADAHFAASSTSCSTFPGPPACSGVEAKFGESAVQLVHRGSAGVFVLLLAVLCWVWAVREAAFGPRRRRTGHGVVQPPRSLHEATLHPARTLRYLWNGTVSQPDGRAIAYGPPRRRALMYLAMAVVILLSAGWSLVGVDIAIPGFGRIGPTYAAEFGAFEAFGAAWITAAWDLMPRAIASAGHHVSRVVDKVTGTPGGSTATVEGGSPATP